MTSQAAAMQITQSDAGSARGSLKKQYHIIIQSFIVQT